MTDTPRAQLRRRSVMFLGAGALLAGAAGCGKAKPDLQAQRRLEALREQTRVADTEAAQAEGLSASSADSPDLVAGLRQVVEVRRAHHEALAAQLRRLDPKGPDPRNSPPTPLPSLPPGASPEPLSLALLRRNLAGSQRLAEELARDSSGYQAGLLGSVSAAIGALLAVPLAEEASS